MSDIGWQKVPNNRLQGKSLTNWTRLDLTVLLLIVLLGIAVGVWTREIFGVAVVLFLLPWLYRPRKWFGRLYREFADIFMELTIMGVLKGVVWVREEDDTSPKFQRWMRRKLFKPKSRRSPFPLSLTQVRAEIRGQEEVFSLLHELDRPYDHLFITADGGSFFNKGASQHDVVNTLGEILDRIIAQTTNLSVGLSLIRVTGPNNLAELNGYLRKNIDPIVLHPDLFVGSAESYERAKWLARYAEQLQPMLDNAGAASPWYLIILTIKRSSAWRRAINGQLSDKQLHELPIAELGRTLVEELSSSGTLDMRNVRSLSLAEHSTVCRTGWDVAGIQDYYTRQAEGIIPRSNEELDAIWKETGADGLDAALKTWPERIIKVNTEHHYVQLDNNLISVMRIVQLPETVSAEHYRLLHDLPKPGVWTRQAMVGQAVSGNAETHQLLFAQGMMANFNDAFYGSARVHNPKRQRRERDLAERTDLVSRQTIGQHYNQLHTVVVPLRGDITEAESILLRQRKQLRASLIGAGFHAEVITGGSRQIAAAISGCLGINRL
ncbi:hypothetical protein FJZ39_00305 [Candidatus Saccharibacteria bacterium]|nr:hypothetical protein [Candidatus Saccharibacteria bacterium]